MDDFTADFNTTGQIVTGASATGEIEESGDRDWFAITLEASQTYFFTLNGELGSGGTLFDPYLRLFDNEGVLLAENDDYYTLDSSIIGFEAPYSGTYYLGAGAYSDDGTGTYTLHATDGGDDIGDTIETAADLTLGATIATDIFYPDDRDVFAVSLEAGEFYAIEVNGESLDGSGLQIMDLFVVSPDNGYVTDRYSEDGLITLDPFVVSETGLYYLDVGNGYQFGVGSYSITLASGGPDAIAGDATTSAEITVGETVESSYDYLGDSDWFAITLSEGDRNRISLAPAFGDIFGYHDPQITVIDTDGGILAESVFDDFVGTWRIDDFEAPESGRYFIAVSGSDYATFDYALNVLTLDPVIANGTEGRDTLLGGAGNDALRGLGASDRLEGFDGDDLLDGGDGEDELLGGGGNDTLLGGEGNDAIAASFGDDSVEGGGGNDLIGGGQGNDTLRGGAGDDGIRGGDGDDLVSGGDGDDRLSGGWGDDVMLGGAGDDNIGAGGGRDVIYAGLGNDTVGGGYDDDVLILGAGDDVGYGGQGADWIHGGTGNDLLFGGGSYDNDTLIGGSGNDTMSGGWGADSFVFEAFSTGEIDVITDYDLFEDRLVLAGVAGSDAEAQFAALDISDGDDGAEISYQGHVIVLNFVSAADIGIGDFVFL
ncbi:calcium-binding protein [Puniceibacterium confluentis]|uniref:calcium-binding protein n=1 Tax=Puniceibacterium confluentis TaxID=1958944 RepID=UPI0011B6E41B|nr:calcium-binding protein [Puniceibacterium confluentis]